MKKGFIVLIFVCLFGAVKGQKGEKSISAGPFIAIPLGKFGYPPDLRTAIGLEAIGQYNVTNRSVLLLQSTFSSHAVRYARNRYGSNSMTLATLKGGYKYQFGPSGFFVNGLVGADIELPDPFFTISLTLGAGKRFIIGDVCFIDAGVDYIDGDADRRLNLKATFSLLRRPK